MMNVMVGNAYKQPIEEEKTFDTKGNCIINFCFGDLSSSCTGNFCGTNEYSGCVMFFCGTRVSE